MLLVRPLAYGNVFMADSLVPQVQPPSILSVFPLPRKFLTHLPLRQRQKNNPLMLSSSQKFQNFLLMVLF